MSQEPLEQTEHDETSVAEGTADTAPGETDLAAEVVEDESAPADRYGPAGDRALDGGDTADDEDDDGSSEDAWGLTGRD